MSAGITVTVQEDDFDPAALQASLLRGDHAEGAVASFTGYVRTTNESRQVTGLFIEHYPGMTEKSISEIAAQAAGRWPVGAIGVVHRVGALAPGDQIVWVGVSSAHREAAFAATEFIMDYLKTRAPFWKRESGPDAQRWVQARDSDTARAARWGQDTEGP